MFVEQHQSFRNTSAAMEQIELALKQSLESVQSINAAADVNPLEDISDDILLGYAKVLVRERKSRHRFFPDHSFGEPVWDILLDLYIAHCTRKPISVSSACIASGVPSTTALRYISTMTIDKLITRSPSVRDSRVVHIKLTDSMYRAMRAYLTHIIQSC